MPIYCKVVGKHNDKLLINFPSGNRAKSVDLISKNIYHRMLFLCSYYFLLKISKKKSVIKDNFYYLTHVESGFWPS